MRSALRLRSREERSAVVVGSVCRFQLTVARSRLPQTRIIAHWRGRVPPPPADGDRRLPLQRAAWPPAGAATAPGSHFQPPATPPRPRDASGGRSPSLMDWARLQMRPSHSPTSSLPSEPSARARGKRKASGGVFSVRARVPAVVAALTDTLLASNQSSRRLRSPLNGALSGRGNTRTPSGASCACPRITISVFPDSRSIRMISFEEAAYK